MSEQKHRPVNQTLGMQPRFGPLPADQVIPWIGITMVFYFLFQEILKLGWNWTVLLIIWGCGTWWVLTGSKSWRFLGKFVPCPSWTRGRVTYRSLRVVQQERELQAELMIQKRQQAKKRRAKSKRTRQKNQEARRA